MKQTEKPIGKQITLDVETTGLHPEEGERVIEIGCVEIINRVPSGKTFQSYLKVDKQISEEAQRIHGISNAALAQEPRFEDIAQDFLAFIAESELLIHNAGFDVPFLDQELRLAAGSHPSMAKACVRISDTLLMARREYPGRPNSLDALCTRLGVDNSARVKHGALRDADLLAQVYLKMTGGQSALTMNVAKKKSESLARPVQRDLSALKILRADATEEKNHRHFLAEEMRAKQVSPLWKDKD